MQVKTDVGQIVASVIADKSKGELNRDRIVAAANMLFYQRGFNMTSFTEVASSCGIPKGNFYYYFKSKDQLLEAVIEFRRHYILDRLDYFDNKYRTARERLKRLARMPLTEEESMTRYGCPIGTLLSELKKTQGELQMVSRQLLQLYVNWSAKQFADLGLNPDLAEDEAYHLVTRLQGMILVASTMDRPSLLQQEVQRIYDWIDSF